MLTLQHPILASAVALVGTLAILLLYILKLRRRPIRVGTTAFFSPAVDDLEANVPWRRLRPSWMLLIHILIIWLLALALGSPVSHAQASRTDLIIVLDHSGSLMATTGDKAAPTQFDRARDLALARANQTLSSGGRVALISAAARPQSILPISTSRVAIDAALQSLKPLEQAPRLDLSLEAARALAATITTAQTSSTPKSTDVNSPQSVPSAEYSQAAESARRAVRILLITDGVSPLSPSQAQGIEIATLTTLPSLADPDNLAITSLVARRQSESSRQTQILLRVLNASSQPRIAPIRIDIDGQPQQRLTLSIPAAQPNPDGTVLPGSLQHTLILSLPGEALISAHITRSDRLSIDDAAFTLIPPPKPRRVLFVTPSGTTDLGSELLRDCLQELVTVQPGESSGGEPSAAGELLVVTPSRASALSSRELSNFSLAIFDRVEPPPQFPIGILSFGVRAGLATAPASPPPTRATRPLWWDRSSPVLEDNPIDSLLIRTPLSISEPNRDARILARGSDGPLILHLPRTPSTPPRLAVLFAISESNWPLQVSFPIFIARAADILSPESQRGTSRSYSTSEPITLGLPSPLPSSITLTRPSSASADSFPIAPNQTEITLGPLSRPGSYRLAPPLGPANNLTSALAVNFSDPTISTLRPALASTADAATPASLPISGATHWWRICLHLAATLLLCEWLIFSWLQHRSAA